MKQLLRKGNLFVLSIYCLAFGKCQMENNEGKVCKIDSWPYYTSSIFHDTILSDASQISIINDTTWSINIGQIDTINDTFYYTSPFMLFDTLLIRKDVFGSKFCNVYYPIFTIESFDNKNPTMLPYVKFNSFTNSYDTLLHLFIPDRKLSKSGVTFFAYRVKDVSINIHFKLILTDPRFRDEKYLSTFDEIDGGAISLLFNPKIGMIYDGQGSNGDLNTMNFIYNNQSKNCRKCLESKFPEWQL